MRFFRKAVLSSIQGVGAKETPPFCSFLRPPTRTSSTHLHTQLPPVTPPGTVPCQPRGSSAPAHTAGNVTKTTAGQRGRWRRGGSDAILTEGEGCGRRPATEGWAGSSGRGVPALRPQTANTGRPAVTPVTTLSSARERTDNSRDLMEVEGP